MAIGDRGSRYGRAKVGDRSGALRKRIKSSEEGEGELESELTKPRIVRWKGIAV
jgi:hypothetical protein